MEFGIEDAGARFAGAWWPLIKKGAAPVLDELQKRYPALFLLPGKSPAPEAKKAADDALNALNSDPVLLKELDGVPQQLEELGVKQDTILKLLLSQNESFQKVSAAVDRVAAAQATLLEGQAELREQIQSEFRKIKLEFGDQRTQAARLPEPEKPISLDDIYRRANGYQAEAMRYLNAGDAETAAERVNQGKALALAGFRREPNDARMLVTLGYLEKTNAEISWDTGRGDPVEQLGAASRYFAKALEGAPEDVGAMNGLADTYIFAKDWDRAIATGEWVLAKDPRYAAAAWDLAIALEGKIGEAGPDAKYLAKLEETYERLEVLIPQQPLQFGPNELTYVQARLEQLRAGVAAADE